MNNKKPYRWAEMKRKTFNKFSPSIRFAPIQDATCPECGITFTPNWQEKNHSLHPKKSLVNELVFIPLFVKITCQNSICGFIFKLAVPQPQKIRGTLNTFIDESYRLDTKQKWKLANYSSVSIGPNMQSELLKQWTNFKIELRENNLIEKEYIHISSIKKTKGNQAALKVINKICKWIKSIRSTYNDQTILINSTNAVADWDIDINEIKKRAFEGHFITLHSTFGKSGVSQQMYIEADGKQGFIEETLSSLCHTAAYPFFTYGIGANTPQLINKGEGFSDLADSIAFFTAKELTDILEGKKPSFHGNNFGSVQYTLIYNNLHSESSTKGFPKTLLSQQF